MKKRRVLKGKSVPEYAAIKPQGKGLMVASEKPFVCTHVDGCPVELPDSEPMEVENTGGSEVLMCTNIAVFLWIRHRDIWRFIQCFLILSFGIASLLST